MTEALPLLAFQAALLFCRIGACCMVLPGIGEGDIPPMLRLALPLALVAALLPVLAPGLPPPPEDAPGLVRLVAVEVATGLWLGWLARLASIALAMAGQVMAFLIGLSSVLVLDPSMGGAGSPLSRFLGLAAAALVLSSGLYAVPLRALADSYVLLPPGGPALPVAAATEALGQAISQSLALALRLAAPFVLLSLLVQVLGGLVARVAPQAQAFVLVVPAQVLLGLLLLGALLPSLLRHWQEAVRAAWTLLPGQG